LKEHYAKNYYADSSELSSNEQDGKFLKHLSTFIEANMDQSQMDVNQIAEEWLIAEANFTQRLRA